MRSQPDSLPATLTTFHVSPEKHTALEQPNQPFLISTTRKTSLLVVSMVMKLVSYNNRLPLFSLQM